jgi:trans-aconitate 2-methyltransferase
LNFMPSWDADQYLKFARERTRPARDLAAAVEVAALKRAVDLGCGPGNSTEILAERWPDAALSGFDSSPAMVEAARREHPNWRWSVADISAWAAEKGEAFDLVYSNAALHWVPNHRELYPRLMERVAPRGALAVQVPANLDAPAHTAMRELAANERWAHKLPAGGVREWHVHDAGFYYDCLAGAAKRIDLWYTEYTHVLDGPAAIVEWYKGTGLRPFLDALPSDGDRETFLAEYLERIRVLYPVQADGRVLFPFRRLFVVAYKAN